MLQPLNYYKSIPCPDPDCTRPYCHFKHIESAINKKLKPLNIVKSQTDKQTTQISSRDDDNNKLNIIESESGGITNKNLEGIIGKSFYSAVY